MIRTRIVELSCLEGVAYRRRLGGGHVAVIILPYAGGQPGNAMLNRNTGAADPAANSARFAPEVWAEAVEVTRGLPFTARGQVRVSADMAGFGQPDPDGQDDADEVATVCSDEYKAIVEAYTDKRGQFSYALLNKDFIQYLKANRHVARMVGEGAALEAIRGHVLRAKLEWLTGNRDLSDAQIARIVNMLDEVSPRAVFRELDDEIKRLLARR